MAVFQTRTLILGALAIVLAGSVAAMGLWPRSQSTLDDFGRYVFVPSRDVPTVAVIDNETDQIVAHLDVGVVPGQIAISEATGLLVASNVSEKSLVLMNLETRVTSTLPLDIIPDHMQLSSDGYLLAIGDVAAGKVSIISLNEKRVLSTIDGLAEPYNLSFTLDSALIYVANKAAHYVSVIDPSQGKVIEQIPVEGLANGADGNGYHGITNVTLTPSGQYGFATVEGGDFVAVLDLNSAKTLKVLTLGGQPWRAYGSADGRLMLVPNNGSKTLSVIDTTSLNVVATLAGAADVIAVNTGWFDSVAFVMSRGENKTMMIDLMTLQGIGEISFPGAPGSGVVTPDGKKLYVGLEGTQQVAVIDTRSRKLVATIEGVGANPWGITMGRSNNYCH